MNKETQTPRRFYKISSDPTLHSLGVQLYKLESQLLQLNMQRQPANVLPPGSGKMVIGPNGTRLSRTKYVDIDWTCHKKATRDMCNAIFGSKVLATHTLRGRMKPQLPPLRVLDIVHCMQNKFNIDQLAVCRVIRQVCYNAGRTFKNKVSSV
ncbi:hypothetical protein KR044_005535 [Drosophila immigrans]|nr:hypothetical protein KR044_005535 [Drosophila immigrans]